MTTFGREASSGVPERRRPSDPLRIAYFVDRFPVLSESFIINEVGGAIERGHYVRILALAAAPAGALAHPDVHRLGMLERTLYLGLPRRPDLWARSLAQVLWTYRGNARTVIRLYDHRRFGVGGDRAKFLHQSLRLVDLPPFDVIHCQFGPLGLTGHRFRACGILQGRLITTFRGHDVSRYLREYGPDVYRRLFEDGDFFLTNCDFFRRRLLELGCDPARLAVQRSGVDVSRFAFRERTPSADGRVVLATVGRLVEKKGIADCLRALAAVVPDHPKLEYRILGDGPLRAELQVLSERLGIQRHVIFLGAGNQDAVIRLLEDAHLFLGPSVTAADGDQDAPINTLKEAMAMGVPVISTWHGGIPELVEDGVSGRLVPERDPAALADALQEMLMDPSRWPGLAQAARAQVETGWDRERLNDQLDARYRSIAQAGGHRGGRCVPTAELHVA
jgi:colanic acid/amylovoran biosynthesis glycosyltransferase